METEIKYIDNLCVKITDGSHFSPEDDEKGQYPMYSVKDMEYNSFSNQDCKHIGQDVFDKLSRQDCRPLKDDIVIAKDGSYLKYVFKVKEDLDACILSSIAILRPNKKVIDPDYFVYLMRSASVKNAMANYVSGSALPRIILSDFKKMKIAICSDLNKQKHIASILSAYDSQIENNQKRIKLLEQMAENLYKEWFVRFRFPGYENAEFEGGVPKGWKIEKLSDVFNFQEGPGIRNWQYVDEDGVKFINIRCIKNGDVKLESASMISKEEAYGKYKHFLLRENDIVMSCSGTLGRSAIIRKEHLPLCLNTSVIRFWPKIQEEDFSFLYGYLHSTDFINKQSEMASGAAQVNFGPMHLKLMKLLVPPKKVRIEYHKVLLPIIQLTLILKKEIDTLSIQRDLLLPRLMSGKLSI